MNAPTNKKIMLGELLLKAGVITEQQLRTALAEQKKWGGKLGSVLVDLNFLDEDMLVKALSKQLGLPRVDFSGLIVSQDALSKLDADFAVRNQVLPISYNVGKNQLVVAMSDPRNLEILDELGFKTGSKVHAAIAGEKALEGAIREYYLSDAIPGEGEVATGKGQQDLEIVVPLGNTVTSPDDVRRLPASVSPAPAEKAPVDKDDAYDEKIKKIELLQRKQVQILKVVVELLMEKGYFTRDEYRQKVEQ
jgi:type IV pilus assembly protein PilB